MTATRPKLYALLGSHPCDAVVAALRLKGIEFDRIDLLPLTQVLVGPLRYGGSTVPGMRIGSERIVGSRAIMRRLDALAPEPPLLPAGEDARAAALEAERWGDEELQAVPRRIIDVAFLRDPGAMESYAGDAKLPLPRPLLRTALPMTARLMAVKNKARDETAKRDIAALPAQLDRIDAWVAEGVLGGTSPNAADLQIGSTLRLLRSIGDVGAVVDGRPGAALCDYFDPIDGEVPAGVLPAAWFAAPARA